MLFAQRFDEEKLAFLGDPYRLADNIGSYLNAGYSRRRRRRWSIGRPIRYCSSRGSIVLVENWDVSAPPQGLAGFATGLALTRDGHRVVIARAAQQSVLDQRLYLYEATRNASPRVLTSAATLAGCPLCSDERIIYASMGDGRPGVYAQSIDVDRQLLFEKSAGVLPTSTVRPTSVSADGRVVLFTMATDPALRFDIWVWTVNGPPAGSPLVAREFDQQQAQLSPDGRQFAYVSNETGRNEVFVADFRLDAATGRATAGESHPMSNAGGFSPRWNADSSELFHLTADGAVMSVQVSADSALVHLQSSLSCAGPIPNGASLPMAAGFCSPFPWIQHRRSTLSGTGKRVCQAEPADRRRDIVRSLLGRPSSDAGTGMRRTRGTASIIRDRPGLA